MFYLLAKKASVQTSLGKNNQTRDPWNILQTHVGSTDCTYYKEKIL